MDDPGTVVYFVAARPHIEKALGDQIYLDPNEARDVAMFWNRHLASPLRVYQAIISQVEEVKEAAVENWSMSNGLGST